MHMAGSRSSRKVSLRIMSDTEVGVSSPRIDGSDNNMEQHEDNKPFQR